MATLLLTRPGSQSDVFAAQCRALGFAGRVLASPLIEIVALPLPQDLARFPTLLFTSANGATGLSGRIAPGQRGYAVGARTAAAVRRSGLPCASADGDVETLLSRLLDDSPPWPCLHLRGVHGRGDLAARLTQAGLPTQEAIVYDQQERPLSEAAREILARGDPVILPLFSPRSAALLGAGLPARTGPRRVLALSAAVRDAWPLADPVSVAARPDAAAMADLVVSAAPD